MQIFFHNKSIASFAIIKNFYGELNYKLIRIKKIMRFSIEMKNRHDFSAFENRICGRIGRIQCEQKSAKGLVLCNFQGTSKGKQADRSTATSVSVLFLLSKEDKSACSSCVCALNPSDSETLC